MATLPFAPGEETTRTRYPASSYTPRQEALWQALDDAFYAANYGYAQTRLPTPGWVIPDGFEAWQQRVVNYWATQIRRDPGTRGITVEDCPLGLWQCWYERALAANALEPTVDSEYHGG